MQLIEKLSERIEEEMNDAEWYIDCAMKQKTEHPVLAETFYKISLEEMQHMALLHDQVVKIIEEYRKAKGDPPADMLAVYNYLHKKHIERSAEIKIKQSLYKTA